MYVSGILASHCSIASLVSAPCALNFSRTQDAKQSRRHQRIEQYRNASQIIVKVSICLTENPHGIHIPCPRLQGCKQLCPHIFLPTSPHAVFAKLVFQLLLLCLSHTRLFVLGFLPTPGFPTSMLYMYVYILHMVIFYTFMYYHMHI